MKKTFTIQDTEYAVLTPTAQVRRDSQIEHSRVFGKLLQTEGMLTRSALDDLITKNKMWNAASKKQYDKITKEIVRDAAKLEAGNMKLNKARELAIDIANKRTELNSLTSEYRQYDDITIDGQAEAAALDYMIAKCLVDNTTGKPVYASMDDYVENKDDVVASMGYINMLQLEYGSANELQKKTPENQFLLEWNFINDDLRFINGDGQLIDREGKLVTEDGEYVDQKKPVEKKPFLNDDGTPIEKPK